MRACQSEQKRVRVSQEGKYPDSDKIYVIFLFIICNLENIEKQKGDMKFIHYSAPSEIMLTV